MNLFENLQKLHESDNKVYYPNGMIVPEGSPDMDRVLTYMYGYDRDMDNSHYTTDEKQKAVDYWIKKNEPDVYEKDLKESINSNLFNEFIEFLKSKNAYNVLEWLNQTENGFEFEIYNGDWKHEHQYIKNLIYEFFESKGYSVYINGHNIDEDEEISDTYSYHYDVILTKDLKEASYGGAYDILDNQYFTKDDLDYFAVQVMEDLSRMSNGDYVVDLDDIYLDPDNNVLEMIISYNDVEYTSREKIDMRKIKTPNHLIKMYANDFTSDFYNQIQVDEFERENE